MPTTAERIQSMGLQEILTEFPAAESVLQQFGLLHYAKTETAKYENLEASALVHAVDLDALTQALMQAIG